jgi:hypothetical protein
MKKRIHIFDEWDVSLPPEPPLPIGTFYARRHTNNQWAVCQISLHYGSVSWSDKILSIHPTKEEATKNLIQLVLKKPDQNCTSEIKKHFWLTPPELWAQLRAEFGETLFDPCPYPRPEGFDGLTAEWGKVSYVNPLFRKSAESGGIGISDWVRKIMVEQKKGRTSVLVFPTFSWFHLLLNARAEMRSLGQVKWLATEDGSPQKAALPIVMFIVRGKVTKK